jgi:hypothetical protein
MLQIDSILESFSDFWIMSGKFVTVLSLIILPITIVVYVYISREIILPTLVFNATTATFESKISPYVPFFLTFFGYFQIFAYLVILLLYPPYPLPSSSEWYFKKRGFIRAVKEYEFVKKVLIVMVPLLILFTTIQILDDLIMHTKQNIKSPLLYPYLSLIDPHIATFKNGVIITYLIVISAISKIIIARSKREFWLYYARGCFVQIQNALNDVDEMRYFVKGLNAYNLYLRKQIKLEIKDLTQFYSKIASLDDFKKNDIIGKFTLFFSYDKLVDVTTLYPLKEISKLLNLTEKDLLIEQTIKDKLKEWGAILAVIIPLIINTITFIVNAYTHKG